MPLCGLSWSYAVWKAGVPVQGLTHAMTTLSEQLFEQLCDARKIRWERIPTADNIRMPDYRVWLNSNEVVVEVKQMDMSKADRQLRKQKGMRLAFMPIGQKRIRNIIGSATHQLRNMAKGRCPTILVVCDNTQGLACLDHEDILNAMYGDEVVVLSVPQDPTMQVQVIGHHFGGNRKMTPTSNRSISAIGLLQRDPLTQAPTLTLYHNIHADVPLQPTIAAQIAQDQYTLEAGPEVYQFWKEVTAQKGTSQ